jgi:hypothetical protein
MAVGLAGGGGLWSREDAVPSSGARAAHRNALMSIIVFTSRSDSEQSFIVGPSHARSLRQCRVLLATIVSVHNWLTLPKEISQQPILRV